MNIIKHVIKKKVKELCFDYTKKNYYYHVLMYL